MVYRLDANDAVYQRFIRCGSAKPVANYYGAVLCEQSARCMPLWFA